MRHFRNLSLSRDVTLVTDHKPLTFAMEKILPAMFPWQIGQLNYVSQVCKTLKYISGTYNQVADFLSRLEINYIEDLNFQIDIAQFARDQVSEQAIRELLQHPTGLRNGQRSLENVDHIILRDVSTGRFRPLVPQTFYEMVF